MSPVKLSKVIFQLRLVSFVYFVVVSGSGRTRTCTYYGLLQHPSCTRRPRNRLSCQHSRSHCLSAASTNCATEHQPVFNGQATIRRPLEKHPAAAEEDEKNSTTNRAVTPDLSLLGTRPPVMGAGSIHPIKRTPPTPPTVVADRVMGGRRTKKSPRQQAMVHHVPRALCDAQLDRVVYHVRDCRRFVDRRQGEVWHFAANHNILRISQRVVGNHKTGLPHNLMSTRRLNSPTTGNYTKSGAAGIIRLWISTTAKYLDARPDASSAIRSNRPR